ncbi:MAG: toast rack family protein [Catalinimonas sp.]
MFFRLLLSGAPAAAALLLTSCFSDSRANGHGGDPDGESITFQETVRKDDDVRIVKTLVQMRAGELSIRGGADDLMDGEFIVPDPEFEPEVSYRRRNDEGRLEIVQSNRGDIAIGGNRRNVWHLRFNERTPMELDIELPAGTADLRLGDLNLEKIEVDAGAGELKLDLRGTTARRLDINTGVGQVYVDLSGEWDHDFGAELNGGIGEVTLVLPRDVGVRVDLAGLGSVDADRGFIKDGNEYRNEVYGDSPHTLRIEVNGALGSVSLELAD